MFNIGSGELLVLLLLGLLVLGPERLPRAMGQVGRYVAQMRKLSSGFQDEIKRAMDPQDVPFRPGEERLRPGNVADEVRVVGVDPVDDRDEDDLSPPEGTDAVADAPFAPDLDRDDQHEPEDVGDDGQATDDAGGPDTTGTVSPLRGHDDGDARAAG